jgi:ATP-binding protein involved in chromosome partitioning
MIFKKKQVKSTAQKIRDIPVKVESGSPAQVSRPKSAVDKKSVLEQKYKIIAITSGKGGVGKSTVTANLAVALQQQGLVVGILDADIYGPCQAGLFGSLESPLDTTDTGKIIPIVSQGVHFVSSSALVQPDQAVLWRAPMVNKLIMQFLMHVQWPKNLDVLLLDLPPGTGDIHITLCQKANIDGAIIVTTPQHVATQVAERGLQMLKKVNVPIWGIIENMSGLICESCGSLNKIFLSDASDKFAKHYNLPIITKIPLESVLCDSSDAGQPILSYAPISLSSQCFKEIANFVQKKIIKNDKKSQPQYKLLAGSLIFTMENIEKSFMAQKLRMNCKCALCVDENTGKKILKDTDVNANISIISLEPVGNYGLQLYFSDGHNTGIYRFEDLACL